MIVDFLGKDIYVEVHGEGSPLVILNGIMMSTKSWSLFLSNLKKTNKVILLDFINQGQSTKVEEVFSIELQADVLKKVLDELKIEKAHIAGISYGASIALQFVCKYESYVNKLLIFNGVPKTSKWLQDVGESWKKASSDPENYYYTTTPVIYSTEFYNKNIQWIDARKELLIKNVFNNKEFINAMNVLIDSSAYHDVIDKLSSINVKTLVVSSEDDVITPVSEQRIIAENIKDSHHVILQNCGHASMYEKPELFLSLLTGFVNNNFDDIGIF